MYNPYELDHKTPSQRDFLDTTNFDQSEILDIVKLSTTIRKYLQNHHTLDFLHNQTIGLLFEQFFTKLSSSFSAAVHQLDGHALTVRPDELALGIYETAADTARTYATWCDALVLCSSSYDNLLTFSTSSTVPVINGASNYNRPVQELADIITILDHLPQNKPLNQVKVIFVGDCTPVCASLMMITTKMGMNFVQYAPPAKWLSDEYLKIGRANTQMYGGSVHVSDNPVLLEGADFIYTDVWYSSGASKELYMREFYPKYQVNAEMFAAANNPNLKFMHCLPAMRGEEVTDNIIDGEASLCWEQSQNLVTAERGLLLYFGGVGQEVLDEIKAHQGKADAQE